MDESDRLRTNGDAVRRLTPDELAQRAENRAARTAASLAIVLDDRRPTVSIDIAAGALGIARTTAHKAARTSGYLTDGVPVFRVGRRLLVSTAHLRRLLAIDDSATFGGGL